MYKSDFGECPDSITKRYYDKYLMIEEWLNIKFDLEQKFR